MGANDGSTRHSGRVVPQNEKTKPLKDMKKEKISDNDGNGLTDNDDAGTENTEEIQIDDKDERFYANEFSSGSEAIAEEAEADTMEALASVHPKLRAAFKRKDEAKEKIDDHNDG